MMPSSFSLPLADLSTFFLALFALAWFLPRTLLATVVAKRPLPPGPPTGWFGNLNLPSSYQWLHYAKWKELYGRAHGTCLSNNLSTHNVDRRHHLYLCSGQPHHCR